MNARVLLAHVEARGASLRVEHGDDGAAVLVVAPRSRCVDLLPDIAHFKPSLIKIIEREQTEGEPDITSTTNAAPEETVAAWCARSSRLRLARLEQALGVEEAQCAIVTTGRRLKREKPSFWEKLDASARFDLAACVALLEAQTSPEDESP